MLSSYFPPEFMVFDEKWGVSLTVDSLTPSGAIIKCTQSGGEPTGELHTGSWYILENWTQENGWREMPYVINGEIGWDDIAWIISKGDTVEWEVNWEWLYGKLSVGKYRIGKSITDFRESGDYASFMDGNYMKILYSVPFWLGGIYFTYKRLLKKSNE